jgi:rare lipoprotein A
MARADDCHTGTPHLRAAALLAAALALAGCQLGMPGREGAPAARASADGTRFVERDVEAPEVFQAEEPGLWDGRPSLGGVWVAHPGVGDPERAIIRNAETGASVAGALFRRERDQPGPRFQVSSEAANALGILAGRPTPIRVTAVQLRQVPVSAPAAAPDLPDAPPAQEEATAAAPQPPAAEPEARRGLRSIFQRRRPAPAVAVEPAPVSGVPVAAEAVGALPEAPVADPVGALPPAPAAAEPPARRGLRSLFQRRRPAPAVAIEPEVAPVDPVAAPPAAPASRAATTAAAIWR